MFTIGLFFVSLLAYVAARPDDGMYTTKFDDINLDEILNSKRMLNGYVDCLMDKKGCTPDGAELKRVMPEALETRCAKCSANQKARARKVLFHLYEHEPEILEKLKKVYDPKGEYHARYCKIFKDEGLDTKDACT